MKTKHVIYSAALTAAFLTTAALAQSSAPAAAANPAPNEIVYVPQLPSPAELSNAATAQGLSVAKIDQTSDEVTVTYKSASGQTNVISYKPISAIEAGAAAPAPGSSSGPAVATTTVVYGPPATPYYYPYGYGYGYGPGWGWYPPVSIGLGFGFHGRWR